MSIALERATWIPVYDLPTFPKAAAAEDDDVASCSSSIGRNSGGMDDGDEGEVQSSYKGPFDTMDSLGDSLPTRCKQAVSDFYRGKSKSYSSAPDVLPLLSSAKDLSKIDNAYSRKRKNLFSFNPWESNPNLHRSNGDIAVSKRPTNPNRATTSTQDDGHSVSSSSGSNNFSNGTGEEYRNQDHHPCLNSVARKKKGLFTD